MNSINNNAFHQQCFLCRFNTHRDSVEMHQFIQENVGAMHIDSLAREVHMELVNSKEQMTDACSDDIRFEVVRGPRAHNVAHAESDDSGGNDVA